MNSRHLRTILTLALIAATAIAPVAPAFGQTQNAPAQTQSTTPQTSVPPQVAAPGAEPAPSTPGAPVAEPAAAPQSVPPPAAPIPHRTYEESKPNFEHGRSAFPDLIGPYIEPSIEQPNLTNSERLMQMIQDGKISLSLQDCIELALENNLDIAIQRYGPWLAEANVLSAKGGGQFASGSLPSLSFDPVVTASSSLSEVNTPVNNPFTTGAGVGLSAFTSHNASANFQYTQGFATGTTFEVFLDTNRQSTSSSANNFNPYVQSQLGVAITQQLLNGFGIGVSRRSIRITKIDKQMADSSFEQQIITSISQVANAYWELVYARENIKVGQQSLTLAQQLYDDNKKQVDIGTLAPLELVQAEAQVAQAQQTLITDQTVQLQDQTTLLNLISKDVTDPALLMAEIIPTDQLETSSDTPVPELADALKEALAKRPDVQEALLAIKADDVNVDSTRNALLPSLSVSGEYISVGLAGNTASTSNTSTEQIADLAVPIVNANGTDILNGGQPIYVSELTGVNPVTTIIPGGLSNELTEVTHNRFPTYEGQLTLTLPIRNRQAEASSARAQLTDRQDEARARQTENGVLVDVRNAIIQLVQGKAAVDAATKTRILQQETLDAEEKKLKLGASNIFNVVTDQTTLATAASAEVRAFANLEEAQVNLDRALARTLDANNITIADAQTGVVPQATLIPGTTASGALAGDVAPAQIVGANSSAAGDAAASPAAPSMDSTTGTNAGANQGGDATIGVTRGN